MPAHEATPVGRRRAYFVAWGCIILTQVTLVVGAGVLWRLLQPRDLPSGAVYLGAICAMTMAAFWVYAVLLGYLGTAARRSG